MLIAVANLRGKSGKSTCAVNLACELAGNDGLASDRWQGRQSVLLSMLAPKAAHYCSGGHLPVSCEHLPLVDSNMEVWVERVRELATRIDYVVVDSDGDLHGATKAIVGICDLVIVPCSLAAADLSVTVGMLEIIRSARAARSDGRPKCLLVPTRVDIGTNKGNQIQAALGVSGEPVGPLIHESAAFQDAFHAGRWIGDFAPSSSASEDIKSLAESVKRALGAKC